MYRSQNSGLKRSQTRFDTKSCPLNHCANTHLKKAFFTLEMISIGHRFLSLSWWEIELLAQKLWTFLRTLMHIRRPDSQSRSSSGWRMPPWWGLTFIMRMPGSAPGTLWPPRDISWMSNSMCASRRVGGLPSAKNCTPFDTWCTSS